MGSIWVCAFFLVLKVQFLEGLSIKALDPGSGVNYYGRVQRNSLLTPVKDLVIGALPRNCKKAPKNSTCIEDLLFNDPNLPCQLFEPVICDPTYPYRHYDGKCNHLSFGKNGIAGECFLRFVAPEYDGYGGIRKSMSGRPLPNARSISLQIFNNTSDLDEKITFLFVVFGQVIAHDMSRFRKPFKKDCCAPENSNDPECLPIEVDPQDPFYKQFQKTCIDFHRSYICEFCKGATRDQSNGATAALDASWLYGENEDQAKKLRAFNGKGELNYDPDGYLPIVGVDKSDEFCYKGQENKCLLTGDPRVNQHASLGSIQTVWLREHNRIAGILQDINPDWDEETLFQESRQILIGEFQCIAFKHFLPTLLSDRIMKEFGTYIEDGSAGTNYDPTVVIAVWNEFSIAAFRLHSLIPTKITESDLTFNETFSNPDLIRQGYAEDIMYGSFHVQAEKYDHYVVDDVSKYLYRKMQDLPAINIQRGRDHGLASYVKVVHFCSGGSVKIKKFNQLYRKKLMTRDNALLLERIYENILDIDLWVGMNLENHMPGSLLGPTAVCIIAKNTFFTMHGDRFFFNHEGPIPAFTSDQRVELKKCSLARVLCDNTEITEITRNPFFLPSDQNPTVSCDEIPWINLNLWQNNTEKHKVPKVALPDADNPNLPLIVSL